MDKISDHLDAVSRDSETGAGPSTAKMLAVYMCIICVYLLFLILGGVFDLLASACHCLLFAGFFFFLLAFCFSPFVLVLHFQLFAFRSLCFEIA